MTWSLEAENFAPNARVLKQRLFDEYGGFADKRIKNLDKSSLFIVDDRATGPSFDARGHLFDWFCTIFARVRGPRTLDVELGRSVPTSKAVDAWMQAGNAKWETGPIRLVVPIELGQEGRLVDLAALVEQIVRPGATYSVPSYKYTCPRTGASLRRLATALKAAGER